MQDVHKIASDIWHILKLQSGRKLIEKKWWIFTYIKWMRESEGIRVVFNRNYFDDTILFTIYYNLHAFCVRRPDKKEKKDNARWRTDINMWETIDHILWIPIYTYASNGYRSIRVFQIKNPVYFNKPTFTKVYITQEEIDNEYGGNKWIVPTHLTILTNV